MIVCCVAPLVGGCDLIGGVLPFGEITFVQLPDEPAFTVAFSVDGGVANPTIVTKVNWVFGDGNGFVEGAPNRTTITYQYAAAGTYQVTAYIFTASGLASTINGTVTVTDTGGDGGDGGSTSAPGKITNPSPVDNAQNVSVLVKLVWNAGADATSHDVYLGLDETGVEDATNADGVNFKGNITTTTFDPVEENPDGLLPNTRYFWRIDAINASGVAKGDVLTFKTAEAPAKAKVPVPATGSVTARFDQVLKWTAGQRATSHDVYFGKTFAEVDTATKETEDTFIGNRTTTSFDPEDEDAVNPGELQPGFTYFWRIDEVGLGGTTKGDIWTFTTRAAPPMVTGPSPADLAVDVDITTTFSWNADVSVESFDVYLGQAQVDVELADRGSPEFKGNQTTKIFNPGTLLTSTAIFWRIDTRGAGGTTRGDVFSFTTAAPPGQVVGAFNPTDNQQNASIDQTLSWNVGAGITETFEVFFSTNQTNVINGAPAALRATLDVSVTVLDLVTNLDPATQYFWRVDAIGPGGRTVGQLLRFRTGALPGPVQGPIPANMARGLPTTTMLQWTPGVGSDSSDVYFGTTQNAVETATESDAPFKGNVLVNTFDPGLMNANTDYFWRIDSRSPGGAQKGTVWKFTTGPAQAINPVPNDNATDIATTVSLMWSPGTGASNHDIYFGTVEVDVTNATPATPGVYRGRQPTTTFNPGSLNATTTYFWRIDEVNSSNDITTGEVWQFTTVLAKATAPIPANLATDTALDAILEWTAGLGSATHDVYFGTDLTSVTNATTTVGLGVFQGNQAGTLFDPPGLLTANTTFFWRVDSVASDTTTRTKGDIWRFTTLTVPPQASNPNPLNGATAVGLGATLSWSANAQTESWNVFFSTNQADVIAGAPAASQGNQAATNFTPAGLVNNTTYFWRIDAVNDAGTTTGAVWSFTTVP
jgi:hypothetical protein